MVHWCLTASLQKTVLDCPSPSPCLLSILVRSSEGLGVQKPPACVGHDLEPSCPSCQWQHACLNKQKHPLFMQVGCSGVPFTQPILCLLSDVSHALQAACIAASHPKHDTKTPRPLSSVAAPLLEHENATCHRDTRTEIGQSVLQVPELMLPQAAAVWQLEVPAPLAEAPPQSSAPGGKAAAPAKGAKPAAAGAAAAAVVEAEPPKPPTRWNCKPTVPTPARHVCVVVGALLQLLGGMQKGSVELHTGG